MTLADARLYLVCGATIAGHRTDDLVPELAGAGVDVLQLREKEMDDGRMLQAAQGLALSCRSAGVPFFVNDRPDVAHLAGATGVHLGQEDLPVTAARQVAPAGLVGWSTHSREQIDIALGWEDRPDYIAVGPVFETPTKPGRPATGPELLTYAAEVIPAGVPWFAIGGIDRSNLADVIDAGARRVVVVRAIVDAPDPAGAAAALRATLDSVPV
ncbi:MAG: thiamine phosphate synthase [Actinomycetota bacterium]|nr:thiamine phosphate synthase [Actinomycetota bacterium]